jgi:hypothetical protein
MSIDPYKGVAGNSGNASGTSAAHALRGSVGSRPTVASQPVVISERYVDGRVPPPNYTDPPPESHFHADPVPTGSVPAINDDVIVETTVIGQRPVLDGADPGGPYAPLGLRWGSFLVFPELIVEWMSSDNANLSSLNARADHAALLAPGVTVRSDWSRHYLEGSISGTRSYYSDLTGINDKELQLNTRGRLDFSRDTNLEATLFYLHTLEGIAENDTPDGAIERTPLNAAGGTLQLTHRTSPVTTTILAGITNQDFDDVALVNGTIANNDDRDYTEFEMTGRLGYEFVPGADGFVEVSGNNRNYNDKIDDNGRETGSSGFQVLAGVAIDPGGKVSGELSAGYARQSPDESTLDDITAIMFNANLLWRVTGLTTVRFDIETEIAETTEPFSAGSVDRLAIVSVRHAFRRHVIGGASFSYLVEDFSGSTLEDQEFTLGLNGEYLISRYAAVTTNYEHTRSRSTAPFSDYVENRFRLGMRLRR